MSKFELRGLPNYEDHTLLAEVRRVAKLVSDQHLTENSFDQVGKCSSSVVRRRFGSWQKALVAAGIPERFSGAVGGRGRKRQAFTDDELVDELRRVGRQLAGQPLIIEAFKPLGRMNPETIRRRFGSWSAALEKAGLSVAPLGRRYSDEQYFENLLRVWTHYGRQPTYREMDRAPSQIPSGAYETKWGTWRKALLAFIERPEVEVEAPSKPIHADPVQCKGVTSNQSKRRAKRPAPSPEDRRQVSLGLRYQVLRRDQFRCVLCGRSPATTIGCELHVDHIVPFSHGGKTVAENLRSLCSVCNLGKGPKREQQHEESGQAG